MSVEKPNNTFGTAVTAIAENEAPSLLSFVAALEGGAAMWASRVDYLGETDLVYIATFIPLVAWVLFRVAKKWIYPLLT